MRRLTSCTARFATRRRPERESFGPELARIAASLGQPLMPWQREVAEVGCEIDPDSGLPAYREVIVTVPRQSGKTTLFLSWQIHRCTAPRWSHPQRSAFTAQSGKDARDKWLDELYPLIDASKVKQLTTQMTRGMGNEYISWKTGSLIRLLSTSSSSGHSKTLHQAVLDEIWHDADDRREQGLRPAMITVRNAQLLVCSTAGTAASVVYNRKVKLGREAVAEDSGRGIAYFEYSAPEGWDPADEDSYFGFMPALCPDPPCRCGRRDGGWVHTVTVDAIRSERVSMEPPEFARAYGNRPTPSLAEPPIDPGLWVPLGRKRRPKLVGGPVFCLDVTPSGAWASVGVAQSTARGLPFLDIADRREGSDWLVPYAVELKRKYRGAKFYALATGAVAAELPALVKAGIEPEMLSATDMGAACVHLRKMVGEAGLVHSGDPLFETALNGAVARPIGEGLWIWGWRKSTVDLSPIAAATGALWGLAQTRRSGPLIVVSSQGG